MGGATHPHMVMLTHLGFLERSIDPVSVLMHLVRMDPPVLHHTKQSDRQRACREMQGNALPCFSLHLVVTPDGDFELGQNSLQLQVPLGRVHRRLQDVVRFG